MFMGMLNFGIAFLVLIFSFCVKFEGKTVGISSLEELMIFDFSKEEL